MIYIAELNNIIIDFDGTAFNTVKAIVSLYDDDFSTYDKYRKIDWTEIQTWDFDELSCASREYINMYFNQKRYFDVLEPMDGFNKAIHKLKNNFSITFCSLGCKPNLIRKDQYIREYYPFADFIGVDTKKYEDKSHIDMRDAIFIDDSKRNLETSNAPVRILFGNDYSWNKGWKGNRWRNWKDCDKWYILFCLIKKMKKNK